MDKQYFGFVGIVGRPNVGKSTLMNHILGQKISITSRRPQTTRNRVVGIDTFGAYQTVYVDTPGLHREEKRAINRLMNRAAESALGDVELILLVVDATLWTDDDEMVFSKIENTKVPVVLVINKIDKLKDKATLLPLIERLSKRVKFKEIVPVSALKGTSLEDLKQLVRKISDYVDFLKNNNNYITKFYDIGDGISVSIRGDQDGSSNRKNY